MSSSSASSASSAATVVTSTSTGSGGGHYRNVLAMMNIEKFVTDNGADIRHQKLLQNIVKILKINDLLEEYRSVIRALQSSCSCKKSKPAWEQVAGLEGRYKELILESCREGGGGGSSAAALKDTAPLTTTPVKCCPPKGSGTNGAPAKASSSSPTTEKNSTTNVLNFSIFNSLKEAATSGGNNKAAEDIKPAVSISSSTTSSQHINGSVNVNGFNTNNKKDEPATGTAARAPSPPNTIEVVVDPVMVDTDQLAGDSEDQNDLIEEEDILEDEEDDAEEELDIEEYMALSEILEKESDPKRFQREEDNKNEFILAIRDTRSKEIICYECVVGGSCGFLSRERGRMLLHIAKHFAAVGEEVDTEDGEVLTEDEEDDDEYEDDLPEQSTGRSSSHNNIDISIIPINADGSAVNQTAANTAATGGHSRRPRKPSKNSALYKQAQAQKAHLLELQQQVATSGNHKIISKPAEKPIHCEWSQCNFQCDQNYKLRTHIRQVHEKVRPYLCDWPGCYGAYKTRSNLASHRMVHTGERPFICDYPKCGAKFARKYDCERHRRIHSEKMFACEWPGCGKRLCDPYNLERHMMVHKGELPFRCPIGKCIRGFRELRYLRDHMVNTHKFLPDTNQLRIACLNSAKVSSISGYNLNESEGELDSEHADMTAFVNAIVASAQQQRAGGAMSPGQASSSNGHSRQELLKEDTEPEEEPEEEVEAPKVKVVHGKPDTNNNSILNNQPTASSNRGSKKNTRSKRSAASSNQNGHTDEPAVVVEVFEPPQTRRSKRVRTK